MTKKLSLRLKRIPFQKVYRCCFLIFLTTYLGKVLTNDLEKKESKTVRITKTQINQTSDPRLSNMLQVSKPISPMFWVKDSAISKFGSAGTWNCSNSERRSKFINPKSYPKKPSEMLGYCIPIPSWIAMNPIDLSALIKTFIPFGKKICKQISPSTINFAFPTAVAASSKNTSPASVTCYGIV